MLELIAKVLKPSNVLHRKRLLIFNNLHLANAEGAKSRTLAGRFAPDAMLLVYLLQLKHLEMHLIKLTAFAASTAWWRLRWCCWSQYGARWRTVNWNLAEMAGGMGGDYARYASRRCNQPWQRQVDGW